MTARAAIPDVTDFNVVIYSNAHSLHRQFPMIEWDDIVSYQYLWWCQHPRKVLRYLDTTLDEEEQKINRRKLSRALRNAALVDCHKEKAKLLGYDTDDLYFYTTGALKELLPRVYDRESWTHKAQELDALPKGKGPASDGNNLVAALVDVDCALDKMPTGQRALLEASYRDGITDEEIGRAHGITAAAARMRVNRAVQRLQEKLGGARPRFEPLPDDPEDLGVRTV